MSSSIVAWIAVIVAIIIIGVIIYIVINHFDTVPLVPISPAHPLIPILPPGPPVKVQQYYIQSVLTMGYLTVTNLSNGTNYVNCNGGMSDATSAWIISPTTSTNVILVNSTIGGSLTWGTIGFLGAVVSVSPDLNPAQALIEVQLGSGMVNFQNAQDTGTQLVANFNVTNGQVQLIMISYIEIASANTFILVPVSM